MIVKDDGACTDPRILLDGEDLIAATMEQDWTIDGLSPIEQRALLARLKVALRDEQHRCAQSRSAWITAARTAFKPGDRYSCGICGRYRSVTHAHHVAPLGMQYDAGVREAMHDYEWLCPTHHAAVHLVLTDRDRGVMRNFIDGFPPSEMKLIMRIVERGASLIDQSLSSGIDR